MNEQADLTHLNASKELKVKTALPGTACIAFHCKSPFIPFPLSQRKGIKVGRRMLYNTSWLCLLCQMSFLSNIIQCHFLGIVCRGD